MKITMAALLVAASLTVPATAHADCGDPGQDPCVDPVPTVDEVVGIMQQLTDPNIPAMSKGNIVMPGFTPDEAGTIDDHLHRMDGRTLPLPYAVTNIQPAPNHFAGATVSTTGSYHQNTPPGPIVLLQQNGHWLITHDTAMTALDAFWHNATRRHPAPFTK
jgi:hypothetical protein